MVQPLAAESGSNRLTLFAHFWPGGVSNEKPIAGLHFLKLNGIEKWQTDWTHPTSLRYVAEPQVAAKFWR